MNKKRKQHNNISDKIKRSVNIYKFYQKNISEYIEIDSFPRGGAAQKSLLRDANEKDVFYFLNRRLYFQ